MNTIIDITPKDTIESKMCQNLKHFLQTQSTIIKRHLDEHKYLRNISDTNTATESFIHDYGWLFRELYCTKICDKKCNCQIAQQLNENGDLLKNRHKCI